MISILTFNHFEVNCSVIFDQTKECVLVDVCCQSEAERKELLDQLNKEGIK